MKMNAEIVDRRKKHVRMRLWLILFCFFCCLCYLLFQGGKLAFMLFNFVAVICLYLLLGRWSGVTRAAGHRGLVGARENKLLVSGEHLSVVLSIRIPGVWPLSYVTVRERLRRRNKEIMEYEVSFVPDWKRRGELRYRTAPLSRGVYHFEPSQCSTEDVFGFFEHQGSFDIPLSFQVLPRTISIDDWMEFDQLVRGMQHHTLTTKAYRETTQIDGVRDYVYGDRISKIHWNATARTGLWKSKEFEKEALPKTLIVLDCQRSAYQQDQDFETAVSAAASILSYIRRLGLDVGMLTSDQASRFFGPSKHESRLTEIQNHLIDVGRDGQHALENVVQHHIGWIAPGSFIVLISPNEEASISQLSSWLKERRMNPTRIWIAPQENDEDCADWTRRMHHAEFQDYAINRLEQLPSMLGGRYRE